MIPEFGLFALALVLLALQRVYLLLSG